MRYVRVSGFLGIIALSACTAPVPEPIRPEPVFNKYGRPVGASCPDGTTAASGSNGQSICVPRGGGDCTYPSGGGKSSSLPCPPLGGDDRNQAGIGRLGLPGLPGSGNKGF